MKKFTKDDLRVNDIVTTRAGNTYTVHDFNGKLFAIKEQGYLAFDDYNNDLTLKQGAEFDIVRVQRPNEAYQLVVREWIDVPVIWERKEVPLLSEAEYHILKNAKQEWQWVARDMDDDLFLYRNKPGKSNAYWIDERGDIDLTVYNHLFPFVKEEDDEPWEIAKLLERYETSKGEQQWNKRQLFHHGYFMRLIC